jgi:hypothetical protein
LWGGIEFCRARISARGGLPQACILAKQSSKLSRLLWDMQDEGTEEYVVARRKYEGVRYLYLFCVIRGSNFHKIFTISTNFFHNYVVIRIYGENL